MMSGQRQAIPALNSKNKVCFIKKYAAPAIQTPGPCANTMYGTFFWVHVFLESAQFAWHTKDL